MCGQILLFIVIANCAIADWMTRGNPEQAVCDSQQMSAAEGATVFAELLYCFLNGQLLALLFCHLSAAADTALLSQRECFCHGWP